MGMREPLANYPALSRAFAVLCDRDGFGFGARRITVGPVTGIERWPAPAWRLACTPPMTLTAQRDSLRYRFSLATRYPG